MYLSNSYIDLICVYMLIFGMVCTCFHNIISYFNSDDLPELDSDDDVSLSLGVRHRIILWCFIKFDVCSC